MGPDNALTPEESVALFTGMLELLSDTTLVPIFESEDSIVAGCPAGGRVKMGVGGFPSVRLARDTERDHRHLRGGSGGHRDGLGGRRTDLAAGGGSLGYLRDGSAPLDATDFSNPSEPTLAAVFKGTLCDHDAETDGSSFVDLWSFEFELGSAGLPTGFRVLRTGVAAARIPPEHVLKTEKPR